MKIHLLIDNERYPLTIRREDELLYRNAAKHFLCRLVLFCTEAFVGMNRIKLCLSVLSCDGL